MIRKIKSTEYLKPYEAMSDGERKEYWSRVGQWLHGGGNRLIEITDRPMAKSQNIVLLSARWSKEDCQAWYDGTLLLSVLVEKTDTWLPTQLFAKSAYRATRQMAEVLAGGVQGDKIAFQQTKKTLPKTGTVKRKRVPVTDTSRGQMDAVPVRGKSAEGKKKAMQIVATNEHPSSAIYKPSSRLVPVRPRHIDQYVHLLPKETQVRAAKYGPLMRDLDMARENARKLMEAGESGTSIEQWAKLATKIDKQVGDIRRELDAEWEKLVEQGRVVVDDLGNAHVVPAPDGEPSGTSADGEPSGTAADGQDEKGELTSEQKARRRELRKFLTDTRRGNGKTREKYVAKWQEAWKEYITLEPKERALKDDKIMAAIKHYEVDVEH